MKAFALTRSVAVLSLFVAGCGATVASSSNQPAERTEPNTVAAPPADTRPCSVNYSVEGNFWKGKLYRTHQEFPRVSKAVAFDIIATDVAVNGGNINAIDRELGLISASATVTHGEGATVPINAAVKELASGGCRVDLSFRTSTGQVALGSVREVFCKALASVEAAQPTATATAHKKPKGQGPRESQKEPL